MVTNVEHIAKIRRWRPATLAKTSERKTPLERI